MTLHRRTVLPLRAPSLAVVALALTVIGAGCGRTAADRGAVQAPTAAGTTASGPTTPAVVAADPSTAAATDAPTAAAATYDTTLSPPAAWLGIDVEEQELAPAHPDIEPGEGLLRTGSVADGEGRLIRGVVAPGGWFTAPVAGEYSVHYSFGPSLCGPDLVVDRTLRIPAPGRYGLPALDEPLKIDCPADTPLQEGFPNPAVLVLVTGPETDESGTIFRIANSSLGGS